MEATVFLPTNGSFANNFAVTSLLPILLAVCVFCYYQIGFRSRFPSHAPHSSEDTHTQGATGDSSRPDRKTRSSTMTAAALDYSNILDSGVEDIQVPILVSRSTDGTLIENSQSEVTLLDRQLDHLMIPVLQPRPSTAIRVIESSSKVTEPSAMPPKVVRWDGRIRWAIGCSIFENKRDERAALQYPQNFLSRDSVSDSGVFQYGLRYVPAPGETNAYRTVKIDKLTSDITLNHVLSVTPGEIYSSRLFDTTAITGYNTVIIVFLSEENARRFVKGASNGLRVGPILVKVTHVNTPTYPIGGEMQKKIQRGLSRDLVVFNLNESNQGDVSRVLQHSAHWPYIERIVDGSSEGAVLIRFHCIKSATAALPFFKKIRIFEKCSFGFLTKSGGELVLMQAW